MWQLVINGPGYFDTRYDLAEGVTQVGRADENEIVLSGDLVSRKHGRFHMTQGQLQWEDLGSRNGSKVNNSVVIGSLDLKAGDVVEVGENKITVAQPTQAETASTELVASEGGGVRRFGRGVDIADAVVAARDIGDSGFLKALDEMVPFDLPPPAPKPAVAAKKAKKKKPSDTDEIPPEPSSSGQGPSPELVRSLVLMYKVAERLAAASSQQQFLDEVTDLVMERVRATTGVVLLKHATGVIVPSSVRHEATLKKGEVPVSDAIVDAALTQGQAIAVANVQDDARFAARDSVVLYGIDQVLCVPIGLKPPFAGVLYLNRSSASPEPLESLLDICTAITQLVQAGLQKFQGTPKADDAARRVLERALPPDAVEARLATLNGAALAPGLEEKQGTVLVAELTNVPLVAQRLPAAKLAELLSAFHRTTKQLVFSFGGTVVRSTGEQVVAFFGGTQGKNDSGIKAVRAAMSLRMDWEIAQAKLKNQDRLGLRAGLHTGKVLLGLVGHKEHLDHALVGDTVAAALALAGAATIDQLLLTAKTLAIVGARFDVSPLGERNLGGGTKLAVFEVLDEDSDSGTLSGVR